MKTFSNTLLLAFCILIGGTSFAQSNRLEKLEDRISTKEYDELAPCVSPDGNTLYFTRTASPDFESTLIEDNNDLSKTLSEDAYLKRLQNIYSQIAGKFVHQPVKSVFNQDIWMAQTGKKEFDIILHPSAPLNNALPNSISSISASHNEVILINQFVEKGGMKKGFSKSKRNSDGIWDFPKPISINNFHNSGSDVNLTFSQNGQVMIMALEREDAYGRSDLYISLKQSNGQWTEPKNMGRGVNTPFREATPHLTADMKQLVFSSDRGNKAGKSNIYVQKRLGDGWDRWSAPQKFRAPINSKANDSHPFFCQNTGNLYFCSDRDGTWDIYRTQIGAPKPIGLTIAGQVFNDATGETIDALIISGDAYDNNIISNTRDGQFRISIPWEKKIRITARKKGFKDAYTVITTGPKMKTSFVKYIKLYLEPIEKPSKRSSIPSIATSEPAKTEETLDMSPTLGAKLELDHIYFKQSTATVLKKSYPEMDRLANYLHRNSSISILIAGHTDNQGDEVLLKKLSVDRASAIKSYLVRKRNIPGHRIKIVGHGSTRALNDNSTERLRKRNRRVEIEVIEVEENSVVDKQTK